MDTDPFAEIEADMEKLREAPVAVQHMVADLDTIYDEMLHDTQDAQESIVRQYIPDYSIADDVPINRVLIDSAGKSKSYIMMAAVVSAVENGEDFLGDFAETIHEGANSSRKERPVPDDMEEILALYNAQSKDKKIHTMPESVAVLRSQVTRVRTTEFSRRVDEYAGIDRGNIALVYNADDFGLS